MLGPTDFAGVWTLERKIVDHLGQMSGTLSGHAHWEQRATETLDYHETGQLRLATGGVLTAERRYRWQWAGAEVAVFFADGAPFHSFRAEGITSGTTHLCGQDTYNVAYDFSAWPSWTATWRVTGPKKDYTSTSAYAPDPLA